ncbi:hypothetical protein FOL47_001655 [Perkinsus chesapeaki]|uniref:Peptidase A1 domain-containing protein n=1 Tax=Perkinsus chesapeaki TaxID=330153 RepID=A0A7J6MHZ6_PERCH|nr:hypothetical protein FOL47_001655 [Perkinsus chesapeaki]
MYLLFLIFYPPTLVSTDSISLPIRRGCVSLGLDGQALNFHMDTGSARSFAIYGPSYEAINGHGSCEELFAGCYFCPPGKSCNDILQRKGWVAVFGDGYVYEYVEHSVALTIGTRIIEDFKIGLVLQYSSTSSLRYPPKGLLGLSFGRGDIPETFLEQLKRRAVISDLVYSIHIEERKPDATGMLRIGDGRPIDGQAIYMDRREPGSIGRKAAVMVSAVTFSDPTGRVYSAGRSEYAIGDTITGVVDSGATLIDIPASSFDLITEKMAELSAKSRFATGDNKIIWEDAKSGWVLVRKKYVKYLPTIVYCIGGQADCIELKVEPKHYIGTCDDNECTLALGRIPDDEFLCLGKPMFRAYTADTSTSTKLDQINYQTETASVSDVVH